MLVLTQQKLQQITLNNITLTTLSVSKHSATFAVIGNNEPKAFTLKINEKEELDPGVFVQLLPHSQQCPNYSQARLGFDAPNHVRIHRAEVLKRIEEQAMSISVFEVSAQPKPINGYWEPLTQTIAATSKAEAEAHFIKQHPTAEWNQHPIAAATLWTNSNKNQNHPIARKILNKTKHHRPPFNIQIDQHLHAA